MKLNSLVQTITTRDYRCHRRRVFYQRLFKGILSKSQCHDLAGMIPYYPTKQKKEIPIGEVSTNFAENTVANVSRISPFWTLFFGFGKFDVTINDTNSQKWVWLW
jgi:hypothetical protein